MARKFLFAMLFFLPASLPAQNRYDIVISEIMADPSPSVGLPSSEWIELKNISPVALNLQSWRIADASGQSGPLPAFVLQPDSFVIVCTGSAVSALSSFGPTISVTSFPSLDNEGDLIYLKAANGKVIHAIQYASSWYDNTVKQDGGWTLEMIDPKLPCVEKKNWTASSSLTGGTPGRKNAVDQLQTDTEAPKLLRSYTLDSVTIILVYDEPLDSLSAATRSNYSLDANANLVSAITLPPLFHTVQVKTSVPLMTAMEYKIIAQSVKDCSGNIIGTENTVKVGVPSDPLKGEWVINEILFNPRSGGYDYVEFYNNSSKIFDAAKLSIGSRNSNGIVGSVKPLSLVPFYVFPGDHIVLTENPENLGLQYLVKSKAVVLEQTLPSLPDDEGNVLAINFQGNLIDEVNYKDDWHFKLIDNAEGIALERVDPSHDSHDPGNWHSAASTAGYGTPGYKNSQYKLFGTIAARLQIEPKIFSPDNDGSNDIAAIRYAVEEPGYVANIRIMDAAGRTVRSLVQNNILGLNGSWTWDGLNDTGTKLPVGIYIIYAEFFNLKGKKDYFKSTIVLARKM